MSLAITAPWWFWGLAVVGAWFLTGLSLVTILGFLGGIARKRKG